MLDQAFNSKNLLAMLQKPDFRLVPGYDWAAYRKLCVEEALESATTKFGGVNPIVRFHLKKKAAYRVAKIGDDLVVRKLKYNLTKLFDVKYACRSRIISNLIHFLSEGVPYRVYRLDVSRFYESFDHANIKNVISGKKKLAQ